MTNALYQTDLADHETPLDAEHLNHMEQGIAEAYTAPGAAVADVAQDADAAALCRDAQCSACLAARLRRAGGMNAEDWARLGIPLPHDSPETGLMADAALEWVWEHTTLSKEKELPNAVKLFVLKYIDLMASTGGVTSESLGGMSPND